MKLSITYYWYKPSFFYPLTLVLLPLSWIFRVGIKIRRLFYQSYVKPNQSGVPVIVVGNLTVGGTGKTPFVIWLCQCLQKQGYRPGIVTRGVGGQKKIRPYWVKPGDLPPEVGDEATMLLRNVNCPLVIGVNRAAAVQDLLLHSNCNIIISDDGLQHYRLFRHMEIAMVDGKRRFGNGCLLPAGPLREPINRLQEVDFIIVNDGDLNDKTVISFEPHQFISLKTQQKRPLNSFSHKKIHAVAAIGNPERFFTTLTQAGFDIIPHVFRDHYHFKPQDLMFNDALPIVMTEKDAVKCFSFASEQCWYLQVSVKIESELEEKIVAKIKRLCRADSRT